jgi:hypothetical protein
MAGSRGGCLITSTSQFTEMRSTEKTERGVVPLSESVRLSPCALWGRAVTDM